MSKFEEGITLFTDGLFSRGLIVSGFAVFGRGMWGETYVSISVPSTNLRDAEAKLRAIIDGLNFLNRWFGTLSKSSVCVKHKFKAFKHILDFPTARPNLCLQSFIQSINTLEKMLRCKIEFKRIEETDVKIYKTLLEALSTRISEADSYVDPFEYHDCDH